MTGLAAVEACVFGDSDADIITKRINDSGANAAACSAPGNDQAVAPEQHQVAHKIASKKYARLLLINNDVLRSRRKFSNDFVRIEVGEFCRRGFGGAIVLPGPTARIPVIFANEAGGINHRQPLGAKQIRKILDDRYRRPAFRAARISPSLDRSEDRLWFVAGETIADVNYEQGWLLAEATATAIARGGKDRAVPVGQELLPEFSPLSTPLSCSSAVNGGAAARLLAIPKAPSEELSHRSLT